MHARVVEMDTVVSIWGNKISCGRNVLCHGNSWNIRFYELSMSSRNILLVFIDKVTIGLSKLLFPKKMDQARQKCDIGLSHFNLHILVAIVCCC